MNRFVAGALGGLLATVPMTAVMTTLWRKLPEKEQYPLPPREITEVTVARCPAKSAQLSDEQLTGLSLSAHFTYGAATGALYPVFSPQPKSPLVFGAGYGVGVWAASYLGWIPAIGILKPATRHPARRNRLMLASHFVWGVATVLTGEWLRSAGRRNANQTSGIQ